MIAFIDEHHGAYGVKPICRVLPAKSQSSPKRTAFAAGLREIVPSTFHEHVARRVDPSHLPACAQRDAELQVEIRRVFEENLRV